MSRILIALPTLILLLPTSEALAQGADENTATACRDGVDNDGDGHVDCADFDCRPLRFCTPVRPEDSFAACRDGIDNDQDGARDCGDEDCRELVFCALGRRPPADPGASAEPPEGEREDTVAECRDGRDNDGDRRVDCRDPDCAHFVICPEPRAGRSYADESTAELCSDRSDNDADGLVDCRDPDCSVFMACSDEEPVDLPDIEDSAEMCRDRADNDADGLVDCQDPDCGPTAACASGGPPARPLPSTEDTAPLCSDGVDNDGDGAADCADPDCSIFGHCVPEASPGGGEGEGGWASPTTLLRVTSSAPGATVYVDGELQGPAPWQGPVAPGEHEVRVEAEGFRPARERVAIEAGSGTTEISLRQSAAGQLQRGIFTFGLGVQVPFLMLGEAATMTAAGGSLQLRALIAAVRSPILLDIGVQLAAGYMGAAEYPFITRGSENHETRDFTAFLDAKYFMPALFLGLTIPIYGPDRPLLALTFHTAQGISVYPVQYFMDVAFGLSYFLSESLELRFEVLGLQIWRAEAYTWQTSPEVEDESDKRLRDVWFMHLAPSVGLHMRF